MKKMLSYFVTTKHHMMIVNHLLAVMMYIVIINGFILRVLREKNQGKFSHGTSNIGKEKLIAKLINLLAPSLSKKFSQTSLQIFQNFM